MHELGIVEYVAEEVLKLAKENNVKKISSVTLTIGEVSGIVPSYLVDCWKYWVRNSNVLEGSSLLYETEKAITYCTHCGKQYETVKYGKVCPYCQSEDTYLLVGNHCEIKEIAVIDE